MWNSEAPLKIFQSMQKEATAENLKKLQDAITADKELENSKNNRDVCGDYAPFCEYCDKTLAYPCARAYIKMKNEEGSEISVDENVAEMPTEEPEQEVEPVEEKPKKVIRIAHIRRTK